MGDHLRCRRASVLGFAPFAGLESVPGPDVPRLIKFVKRSIVMKKLVIVLFCALRVSPEYLPTFN